MSDQILKIRNFSFPALSLYQTKLCVLHLKKINPLIFFIGFFTFIWQNLKQEHTILCNEIKSLNTESFPGPDVSDAFQLLSMPSSLTKSNFLPSFFIDWLIIIFYTWPFRHRA